MGSHYQSESDSRASASSSRSCSSSQASSTFPGATRTSSPVSRREARPDPRRRARGRPASSCGASCGRPTSAPPARRRGPTCPARRSAARAGAAPSWSGTASTARACPSRQLAALDHREHVVGQLEQPEPVRDGRLRTADALGDLAERELELVDEQRVAARLLDRREVLAGDVLDEAEQQRVAVVGLADHGRHGRHARLARRPPAALAGDQLVAALEPRPQRRPAGSRPACRIESASPAVASCSNRRRGCLGFGVDLRRPATCASSAPPRRRSGPRSRGRDRGAGCFSCVRQAPSPPSSRPRRRASAGRSG